MNHLFIYIYYRFPFVDIYCNCPENFFRVKVAQKLSHVVPNLDPYTSSHFDSFLKKTSQFDPEELSQIDANSTMTQLLSQVNSKKLALFLVT